MQRSFAFLVLVSLAIATSHLSAVEPIPRPATEQPNIILIMADGVSWEAFGCYGGEDYKTPNIDALAQQGIRFQHCYSTPICTPSRVKLMTGQYNFRNYTHFGYLNPNDKTFGHLLQAAGYKTAIAGKWQLNGLYNNLPGSKDRMRPLKAGFDESYLWQVTRGKQLQAGGALISAWLIAETGDPIAPGYWVAAASLVSLVTAAFLVHETRHQSLA